MMASSGTVAPFRNFKDRWILTPLFVFRKTAQGYRVRQRLIVEESIILRAPNSRLAFSTLNCLTALDTTSVNNACNILVGKSRSRLEIWEALKESIPICLLNLLSLKLLLISRKLWWLLSWA